MADFLSVNGLQSGFVFQNFLPKLFCGKTEIKILAVLVLWDSSGVNTAQNQENTM